MVEPHQIVEVFICRADKVLILQRAGGRGRGWWSPPGGLIEVGEDAATAALRETFEETGLRIEHPEMLRRWRFQHPADSFVREIATYVALAPEGDVTLSAEHTAYEWTTPTEYADRFCSEHLCAAVPDYAQMLRETRVNCGEVTRRHMTLGEFGRGAMWLRDFRPGDRDTVLALNVMGTNSEFDITRSARNYPDLLDIAGVYQHDGAFLVGESRSELVAMGAIRRLDGESFSLMRIRVAIPHQRRRYASRLIDALEARARSLGASRIVLDTTDKQVAAQRLYESLGYAQTHRSVLANEHGTFHLVHYEKRL